MCCHRCTKFVYRQSVRITHGFYRGQKGYVMLVNDDDEYLVSFSTDTLWFKAEDLEGL